MNREDIVKVLIAAKNGTFDDVKPDLIPGWDSTRLSSVVGYCADNNLIRAIEVTNHQSPLAEYILQGITSKGEDYLKRPRPRENGPASKRWYLPLT